MPFVGKTDRNAVVVKGPKFLDESVIQFFVPLAGKKLDDGIAA